MQKIYDIVGIGIGPFNLGLAALADSIPGLTCAFFDNKDEFTWHPGMLLPDARLQVPYYADLVTLADPCSRFNYFSFLRAMNRTYKFFILENNFMTRIEYVQYCRWVADQLSSLHFGFTCKEIHNCKSKKIYKIIFREVNSDRVETVFAKHIVIGIGAVPQIPTCALPLVSENVFHSSEYLFKKEELLKKKSITIIGSGQSAAEIFYDLLEHSEKLDALSWLTRSAQFYPMDNSKFAFEMTSPDYIDYFFGLEKDKKKKILIRQDHLYKGINQSLISDIHAMLYKKDLNGKRDNIHLVMNAELQSIEQCDPNNDLLKLRFFHGQLGKSFSYFSQGAILCTGYVYRMAPFIEPVKELLRFNADGLYDVQKNYSIDNDNSIFVQNAELHTHGFNAADLGMGPYRNAIILNSILGRDHFLLEKNIAFQTFGIPG